MSIGRVVLFLLVGIHWILPFTPVNPHEEARIVIASVVLGAAFLTLSLRSYRHPTRSFALAGALVTVVITVSALTGASPVREGAVVKGVFLSGLAWGAFRAATRDADEMRQATLTGGH